MLMAAFTSALQAKPQAVHRNTAWLSREPRSTRPHAEHRWLVNAGLIFSTRPGALSSSRRTSSPHPDRQDPPVQPGLGRTLRPGFSRVPFADRVMFLICRSSTRITSNRRAMSCWSSRPSPCAGPSPGPQPGDRVLDPATAVRAPLGAGELALQPPQPGPLPRGQAGAVQQFPGGQGRGDRHPPVDAHRLAVTGGGNRRGDHGEGDMPAAGAVHRHPVGLRVRRYRRDQRNRTHPALGTQTSPTLRDKRRRPTAARGRRSGIPHPGRPCATTAAGPGSPVEERGHRLGEVAQRLLLDRLGAGRQPRVLGSGLGELPALFQVARRAGAAGVPVDAARRPGSTRTGRGRSGPAAPPAGRGWGGAGTGTCEHTIGWG